MKKTVLMFATAALAALSLSAVAGNKVSAATEVGTTGHVELTVPTDKDGNKGTIELTQAPSFEFGSHVIDASASQKYEAVVNNSLQVVNPGIAATWNVNVAGEKLTSKSGTELRGATFTMTSTGVTNSAVTGGSEVALPSVPAAAATIDGTAATTLALTAEKDGTNYTGVGTTDETFTGALTVPAGNVEGDYTANLTWTLSQDPSND